MSDTQNIVAHRPRRLACGILPEPEGSLIFQRHFPGGGGVCLFPESGRRHPVSQMKYARKVVIVVEAAIFRNFGYGQIGVQQHFFGQRQPLIDDITAQRIVKFAVEDVVQGPLGDKKRLAKLFHGEGGRGQILVDVIFDLLRQQVFMCGDQIFRPNEWNDRLQNIDGRIDLIVRKNGKGGTLPTLSFRPGHSFSQTPGRSLSTSIHTLCRGSVLA